MNKCKCCVANLTNWVEWFVFYEREDQAKQMANINYIIDAVKFGQGFLVHMDHVIVKCNDNAKYKSIFKR